MDDYELDDVMDNYFDDSDSFVDYDFEDTDIFDFDVDSHEEIDLDYFERESCNYLDSDNETMCNEEIDFDLNFELNEEIDYDDVLNKVKNTKGFILFVKGLGRNKVSHIFKDCRVKKHKLLRNQKTKELTGSGYVHFEDVESMNRALKKNETELNGRLITVESVKEKKKITIERAVFVTGLNKNSNIKAIFQDCNIKSFKFLIDLETNKLSGRVLINLEDKSSLQIALSKNETEIDGCTITVEPTVETRKRMTTFSAIVEGLNSNIKIQEVFQDCKIQFFKMLRDRKTNKLNGNACIHFEDKRSLETALSRNETKINGCKLIVEPTPESRKKISKLTACVEGLSLDSNIRNIFKDCEIKFYQRDRKLKNEGRVYVNFKDEKSLEKALLKDGTIYNGCVIKIYNMNLSVFVRNLEPKSNIQDVFKGCNIHSFEIIKDKKTNKPTRNMIVYFKNIKSVKTALSASNTLFEGHAIKVELVKRFKNKQFRNLNKKIIHEEKAQNKLSRDKMKPKTRKVTQKRVVKPKLFSKINYITKKKKI